MPSLPPYSVTITSTPAPSANGRSWAACIRSCQLAANAPDSRPAAPTPVLAIRNLRRLISGIGDSGRKVFGRVARGGDQLRWLAHQGFQRVGAAIRPPADADEIADRLDAVTGGDVFDAGQVALARQPARGAQPRLGAGGGQLYLAARPAAHTGWVERTLPERTQSRLCRFELRRSVQRHPQRPDNADQPLDWSVDDRGAAAGEFAVGEARPA